MEVYVIVDVGCIECGEPTKVVGVYKTLEEAKKAWYAYLREVGAHTDKFQPASAIKLLMGVDEGEICEQGYFSTGQHSVEIHKAEFYE